MTEVSPGMISTDFIEGIADDTVTQVIAERAGGRIISRCNT
ncbi:hypothetical protein [Roseivivax isoporae]|uniref:Uncharacterized protein n=1 Tax=Roseivivax isoporae LMG 25204 TaxID=1449351 RepID=X7F4E7_9RHOB|nr:hypothetical protein [Roseivivax isoporae]ETX26961.1 hypothetical protein RISW2_17245 [Roseivivax isoporae LMG 25204]